MGNHDTGRDGGAQLVLYNARRCANLFNAVRRVGFARAFVVVGYALVAALAMLATPALAQAGAGAALPDVLAARVTTTPDRARLILDLSAITPFAIVSLDGPNRIVVDVKAANVGITTQLAVAGTGIVSGFSTVMAEDGRARTELVLTIPAIVQQAYQLDVIGDQPARLVVDLITTTEEQFAANVARDLAAAAERAATDAPAGDPAEDNADNPKPEANDNPEADNNPEPEANSAAIDAPAPLTPEDAPASSAAPEMAVSTDDLRLAPTESGLPTPDPRTASLPAAEQQTALPPASPILPAPNGDGSKPLLVLDPGHGGIDAGAESKGIREKDITLAFALQLRDLLIKTGQFEVALTRDDDTYLTLNQRVDFARKSKAALFLSLHADTFQQADIRGASIYTRDERATDILDKVLADNENRRDIVAGFVFPEAKPVVTDILLDLMRRQMRQQSFVAAEAIVKAMEPTIVLRRFPVRQADFFVLQAPDIPSMLIELGFLSNPGDVHNFEDDGWRDKVAEAIVRGIEAYFAAEGRTP